MKKIPVIITLICLLSFLMQTANSMPLSCTKNNAPKVIKPMANWDIIATNIGTIHMADVFSGDKLTYSISTHPTNKENLVTINHRTGVISIKAERKDNFDVTVTAKNGCGTVVNTFNVIIDEEE